MNAHTLAAERFAVVEFLKAAAEQGLGVDDPRLHALPDEFRALLAACAARWHAERAAVVADRDEARANYAHMVERAADQRLDGYRELGQRCAVLEGERDRLRAELAKPVASPWASNGMESDRLALRRCVSSEAGVVSSDYAASPVCRVTPLGWSVSALTEGFLGRQDKAIVASGPETGDEGRRLADAAAVAAGWRLL